MYDFSDDFSDFSWIFDIHRLIFVCVPLLYYSHFVFTSILISWQSPYNAQDMPAIADMLKATGLQQSGFILVNSDAGWQPAGPKGRNSSGYPIPNMKPTADALHSKGFKMGLYSALSSVQCGIAPGGLYHEDLDAAAYASWGLDYLKYDNCAEYVIITSSPRFELSTRKNLI